LKATAPAPQQPANASTVSLLTPSLVVANSTLKYLGDVSLVGTLQYRFVVETTSVPRFTTPDGCRAGLTTARWRQTSSSRRRPTLAFPGGTRLVGWTVVAYWTFTTPRAGRGAVLSERDRAVGQPGRWQEIGTLVGGAQLARQGRLPPDVRIARHLHAANTLTSGAIECLIEGWPATPTAQDEGVQLAAGLRRHHRNPYRFTSRSAAMITRIRESTGSHHHGNATSGSTTPTASSQFLGASKVYYHRVSWGGNQVNFVVREGRRLAPRWRLRVQLQAPTARARTLSTSARLCRGRRPRCERAGIIVRYFYVSQGGTCRASPTSRRRWAQRTGAVPQRSRTTGGPSRGALPARPFDRTRARLASADLPPARYGVRRRPRAPLPSGACCDDDGPGLHGQRPVVRHPRS